MIINKSEQTTFWDVDGTLITHIAWRNKAGAIPVKDPILPGSFIYVVVNAAMIRLMREEKHRGACIKVWSRGGWEWAANVIIALGLDGIVDEVMSKPHAYFDDVSIEQWLPNRVFIPPGTPYKGED